MQEIRKMLAVTRAVDQPNLRRKHQGTGIFNGLRIMTTSSTALTNEWIRNFNWTVKLLLISLLLVGVIFPDLPQIEGKGWPWRASFSPLVIFIVPIFWWTRGGGVRYPHLVDSLLVTPLVIDVAGNVADFYGTYERFDDCVHFLSGVILVAAVVIALAPLKIADWNKLLLGTGFGATAAVIFEGLEYLISKSGATGLNLTYADTISDLMLGTVGGALGAFLVVRFQRNGAELPTVHSTAMRSSA
jgi:hypothetical protein